MIYVSSNTLSTFEAQLIQKSSNTETELKTVLLIKKTCSKINEKTSTKYVNHWQQLICLPSRIHRCRRHQSLG